MSCTIYITWVTS